MLREIKLKEAMKNVLEAKPVLAAVKSKNEDPEKRRYIFRSLNEILEKYRSLVEDDLTKKRFDDFLSPVGESTKKEENTQIAPQEVLRKR